MNIAELRAKIYPLYKFSLELAGVPLHLPFDYEGQAASDAIGSLLSGEKPCMVCRFGSLELSVVIAHLNMLELKGWLPKLSHRLRGESLGWDSVLRKRIFYIAGFFPPDPEHLSRFAELMLADSAQIDLLGSWRPEEPRIKSRFPDAKAIPLGDLEPYYYPRPWSRALAGRKVLVIHPFTETIKRQYAKREKLFSNPDVLPDFELKTITAVQSLAGNKVEFPTWFDALKSMCDKIDKTDFDIALIGAGAYGFPLAAHVKRIGKKAVHMGGASQLLFGISGKRWDGIPFYQSLCNEHWTRPSPEETPTQHKSVEGGSYW